MDKQLLTDAEVDATARAAALGHDITAWHGSTYCVRCGAWLDITDDGDAVGPAVDDPCAVSDADIARDALPGH